MDILHYTHQDLLQRSVAQYFSVLDEILCKVKRSIKTGNTTVELSQITRLSAVALSIKCAEFWRVEIFHIRSWCIWPYSVGLYTDIK